MTTSDSSWFELDNGIYFGEKIIPVDEVEECLKEPEIKD